MSQGALSPLRVIDLTHYIAGPYCTKLMAGFGAEVIKVERPITGDKMRSMGPFYEDEPGLERSIPFLWLNTGKKSVTLNLKSAEGVEILKQLVKEADVLIENFSPRVMPGLGLSYETLRQINPKLVMTSISNFGQTGPYRDYRAEDIVEYALSGAMYLTGDPAKPPLNAGPAVCQYAAGLMAYTATLIALFQTNANGEGNYVDISIQECALSSMEISLVNYLQMGTIPKRNGDRHPMVPWRLYKCADGEVAVIGGPYRYWLHGAKIFGDSKLVDTKYRRALDRIQQRDEFEKLLEPHVSRWGKAELFHEGQSHKLAFGYLADLVDVMSSPQLQSRQFFQEINHPVVGNHKYCGAPFKMSATPWQHSRAPLLGEHNLSVYNEIIAYLNSEVEMLKEHGVI